MAKRKQGDDEPESAGSYVPAIYARNLIEAEFYKGLLASNDIPALIEDEAGEVIGMPSSIIGQGIRVLVPDEMLDEASEILGEHEDTQEDQDLEEFETMDDEFDGELDEIEDLEEDDLDDDELDDDLDDDDLEDDLDDDLDDDDDLEDEEEEDDQP